jgi:hypothetical protein
MHLAQDAACMSDAQCIVLVCIELECGCCCRQCPVNMVLEQADFCLPKHCIGLSQWIFESLGQIECLCKGVCGLLKLLLFKI